MPPFLQPLFLWFAAALAVPLVLHLLQRRRTVRQPFPTLRFLRLAQKRSASRIRFENLLLWLLRTTLLAALVGAFAMPVLQASGWGDWLGRAPRDVAIVLDGSYSMVYATERGTAWQQARDAAAAILDDLQPGDRACLFLAADATVPVVPEPTSERGAVLRAVRGIEWRQGTSRLDEALQAALRGLEASGGREREVFLLTDGQALPWQGFRERPAGPSDSGTAADRPPPFPLGPHTACFALLAGPLRPANTWAAAAVAEPALLLASAAGELRARIGRIGDGGGVPVSLVLDGREAARQEVRVQPDGMQSVSLPLAGLAAGIHAGRVAVPADALGPDDGFDVVLRVRETLPALVVGAADSARFLLAALRPGGRGPEVRRLAPSDLDGADLRGCAAVFLVDALPLSGQAQLAIEGYVAAGGVVAVFPGDRAAPADYAAWPLLPARPGAALDLPPEQAGRTIRRVVRDDPLFAGFALPPGTVPSLALKRLLPLGEPATGSRVLLATDRGEPLLAARGVGRGRVFLFAVAADRRWSTLPLTALFLPIAHQIVRFAGSLGQPPPSVLPGRNVPVESCLPDYLPEDRILSPGGRPVTVHEVRDETTRRFAIDAIEEIGIYTRQRPGAAGPEPAFAVNADRAESRLDPVDTGSLSSWTGLSSLSVARNLDALRRAVAEHRRGKPLSEPLLWLALVVGTAEWWLANRTQRRRPRLSDRLSVEPSGRVRRHEAGPAT
jgi:hypothetical protein